MGTINKHIFEKAGARGCCNSDYNLVSTKCCDALLVEDSELNDIYFDPNNLSKFVDISNQNCCPLCSSGNWDFTKLDKWPKSDTKWQWAYDT